MTKIPSELAPEVIEALVDYWLNVYNEVMEPEVALCETLNNELLGQVWWAAFRRLAKENEAAYLEIVRMNEFAVERWLQESFVAVRAECMAIDDARSNGRMLKFDVDLDVRLYPGKTAADAGVQPEAIRVHRVTVDADGPHSARKLAIETLYAQLGVKDADALGVGEVVWLRSSSESKKSRYELLRHGGRKTDKPRQLYSGDDLNAATAAYDAEYEKIRQGAVALIDNEQKRILRQENSGMWRTRP